MPKPWPEVPVPPGWVKPPSWSSTALDDHADHDGIVRPESMLPQAKMSFALAPSPLKAAPEKDTVPAFTFCADVPTVEPV